MVGESSGDLLGADLLDELSKRFSRVEAVGIGGPKMVEAGFKPWYSSTELSVMGYVEVLSRLPRLLQIRSKVFKRIREFKPDLFLGIDAPDFNLRLEMAVRKEGIPVVHYVSPSIWAWRYDRIHKIRLAVDKMLVVFPFEKEIYEREAIPVSYVGHPLADRLAGQVDKLSTRKENGLDDDQLVLALLPGSRDTEIKQHLGLMLDVAKIVKNNKPKAKFLLPAVNADSADHLVQMIRALGGEFAGEIRVLVGGAHEAFAAADVAVVASGTATLEGMLLECPMVVTYRVTKVTAWLMRRSSTAQFIALPNIIAGLEVVPELVQEDADSERIAREVLDIDADLNRKNNMINSFREMNADLSVGSACRSADAIAKLLKHYDD